MWQSYSNVPAVVNVRAADMLAFVPGIASGAPAGELSKKTLWATSPKAKVTVPPTPIATLDGVKLFVVVAFTVAVIAGGPPLLLLFDVPEMPDELQATASAASVVVRTIRIERIGKRERVAMGRPTIGTTLSQQTP